MAGRQGKLGDFSDDDALDASVDDMVRSAVIALSEAPENAEPMNPLSCPWCLAPPDDFRIREPDVENDKNQVSCGHCSAVIPYEAPWYLRGHKICLQS